MNENAYTVFLTPSLIADIKAVCYDYMCNTVEVSYGTIASAVAFLAFFRGLPLDTIEVEFNNKITCAFIELKSRSVSINASKCKQLLEKTHIFAGNVENTVDFIFLSYHKLTTAVIRCKDVDLFDQNYLLSLLSAEKNVDIAVAFSEVGDIVKLKYSTISAFSDRDLISALAVYESLKARSKKTFTVNGEILTICPSYTGIKLTFAPPPFMRFDTPYL